MTIHNTQPVVRGLVNALLSLESAGLDEVNPDAAVHCMENIASSLRALDKVDQLALRSQIQTIAEEQFDPSCATFMRSLADHLGLAGGMA